MKASTRASVQALRPDKSLLQADAIAGLTFAIVNVPQAMAHAYLAMVNPVFGIYTLMVAVPVGAIFTSSVFMNVSTTGALSVAAGDALASISGVYRMQALAALVLLVGLIQLAAGLFRLGSLLRFVSNAVMTGFLNGVAVLIILGQLNDLTGFQSRFTRSVPSALELLLRFNRIDIPTTIIGGLTMVLIVALLRTRWRKFAFIIAIGVATFALTLLSMPSFNSQPGWQSVRTVGDITTIARSLPSVALPAPEMLLAMILPAFSVAVIGLIQGAGVSQGYVNPDGKFPNVSRDFFGQGAANLATSFVGGVPAGGSISGTVVIMSAGARSRWANILAGLFVAAIVLIAAPLVELVPMPALSALLIVAGYQGLRIEAAMMIWNTSRVSSAVMGLTFLATLFIPLQYAVLLGAGFSIVMHVARQSNKINIVQWVPTPGGFPLEEPAPRQAPSNRLTLLQIYGSLFFAAAKTIEETLPDVSNTDRAVIALILRGRTEIGSTFVTVLRRYVEALNAQNGRLMLVGIDARVHEQLKKTGLAEVIGAENIFLSTPRLGEAMNRAIAHADAWLEQAPTDHLPE